MSGYCGFSKSNNAIQAEESGRFPASALARQLGVSAGAIRALLRPCEWHHASKFYNAVNYYDLEDAAEIIEELREWQPIKTDHQTFCDCSGEYLIWGGTRNHPVATKHEFINATVTRKGDWFVIEIPGQKTFRKKSDTRGFTVRCNSKLLN